MANRKKLSKSERFKILCRDGFACQYCGARPHKSQLQIDHIVPFSRGGPCADWNFLTACEDCNFGKSDRPARRLAIAEWMFTPVDIIKHEKSWWFSVKYNVTQVPSESARPYLLDEWVQSIGAKRVEEAYINGGDCIRQSGKPFTVVLDRVDAGWPGCLEVGDFIQDACNLREDEGKTWSEVSVLDVFDLGPQEVLTWADNAMQERAMSPTEAQNNAAKL